MPELPEVAYFKNYVDATSLHQKISEIEVLNDTIIYKGSAGDLKEVLRGSQFTSTSTHGKYLFLHTDNNRIVMMHFGMTGKPVYYKLDDEKPDYPRVIFHFDNGYKLAFNCMRMLGEVGLITDEQEFISQKELGPDVNNEDFNLPKFKELLEKKRGMIKSALMDQSFVAGIGNECSDEILYQAKIHPKTNIGDLSESQIELIFTKMQQVIAKKIEALKEHRKLPDNYILRNREEGAECPRCGGTIQKISVSGRNGYYCPTCQEN
ncbi:MAG: DNA-formamidopyrimidine glycosylase family protein [Balneolaceae bacterium]|nr:DNA-formamidopyrimidine glycosylase family protein [Balneolaceae bacterium]